MVILYTPNAKLPGTRNRTLQFPLYGDDRSGGELQGIKVRPLGIEATDIRTVSLNPPLGRTLIRVASEVSLRVGSLAGIPAVIIILEAFSTKLAGLGLNVGVGVGTGVGVRVGVGVGRGVGVRVGVGKGVGVRVGVGVGTGVGRGVIREQFELFPVVHCTILLYGL
jgi:hypothetical protein